MTRFTDIVCVFRIQLAGMRRDVGPFLLAALVFPSAMYLFANAVGGPEVASAQNRLRFLAGSIVFLLVGRALGVQVRPNFLLLGAVLLLTILCLCGLGVIIAARARSFSQGSLLTDTLGAGLVFLAPVYYAPEMMPHGLRLIGRFLPTTFAARALQTTLAGGHAIGGELFALSLTTVVTLSIGFRLMKWRED